MICLSVRSTQLAPDPVVVAFVVNGEQQCAGAVNLPTFEPAARGALAILEPRDMHPSFPAEPGASVALALAATSLQLLVYVWRKHVRLAS